MSEKEDSMTTPTDLQFNSIANEVEIALSQTINLSPDKILHEPSCVICSATNRDEIEKKYSENKNTEETISLFKSKSHVPISKDIVVNHMRHHCDIGGIKEIQKIEYIGRINRLNSMELTTLDRIKLGFSAIEERLMGINSISPSGDLSAAEVEKIKSSETSRLMTVYNQLLKLKATMLGEMKNSGELISLPRQAFVEVFNKALSEAEKDSEKELLKKILSELASLSTKTQ
jgi:hypothetical protein